MRLCRFVLCIFLFFNQRFFRSYVLTQFNMNSSEEETPSILKIKKRKSDSTKTGTKKKKLRKGIKESAINSKLPLHLVYEELFNNNLFRLQVDELLKEVEIKQKRRNSLKVFLQEIKEIVENLDPIFIIKDEKSSLKSDQVEGLNFHKPEKVECFGLYENDCLPGPVLETGLNLIMPRTCFNTKDFLNNRYFVKRLLYLKNIFKHLPYECKRLEFYNDNVLLPIIHVTPKEKIIIKIFATPPNGYFKTERFLPKVNNMKKDLFQSGIKTIDYPTVLYNSTLAFDATLDVNSRYIVDTLKDQENIRKALKLLCIWLKQHHLDLGFGSVSYDLVMYYMAFLLTTKKINNMMSPYSIMRVFWNHFAEGRVYEFNCLDKCEHEKLFSKYFKINLIDKSGCFNLAAFWDEDHVLKFQKESQRALELLESCNPQKDGFQCLFLTKVPVCLQYDVLIDLTESLPLKDIIGNTTDEEKSKFLGYKEHHYIHEIKALLRRGLTNRVEHIIAYPDIKYPEKSASPVLHRLQFCLSLDMKNAFNFIEKGPPLHDSTGAQSFREFWGHLSTDRRFQDGSTNVAVYFNTTTFRGKRQIIKRIVKFILNEKLNLKFQIYYDQFEDFLLAKRLVSHYPAGTNEEHSLKCITVADELGQKLRSLKLPLGVYGIRGLADAFSYCQVFPPVASKVNPPSNPSEVKENCILVAKKLGMVPRYIEPLEVVLRVEQSSQWPKDLEALKNVRTSYFLEISKLLTQEHNILSHVVEDYLQVYYEGLVFRYRIFLPHECHLYDQLQQREAHIRNLKLLPDVNESIKSLQHQFPSFGPGTALIKRWLRSHMIDPHHLPDHVINLLNASLYLNRFEYPAPPNSPQMSFFRFLKFMSEFDWETQPVLVNFHEVMNEEQIKEAETNFRENRVGCPPLTVLLQDDLAEMLLTKTAPSREVLGVLKALCRGALGLVVNWMEDCTLFNLNNLFKPNLDDFKVLIHIKALMNPQRHEQVIDLGNSKIELQEYKKHKAEKMPIVGFNPIDLYLKTLRANYGEVATFFHDSYGGNIIGVIWNPTKQKNNLHCMKADGYTGKLVLNEDALIEDFYLEGKGIVKWIEKKC